MGIFEAFARQSHVAGNPLGPLRRIFSVVGVSSFEDTFADARYITNFALSARALIVHYNLSGIDLDYENSDMTHAQSWQFLALVRALREQLPRGTFFSSRAVRFIFSGNLKILSRFICKSKYGSGRIRTGAYITLDLMCGRDYLTGAGGKGFAPGVLQRIAQAADVLNLMTYEMRNAESDYRPDGSGRTGFNTNLYPQSGAPIA